MAAAQQQRYREFRMPDVGEGLTEAEILKWLVQPGDAVTDGQVVVEVETAKAAVELPIPYDGLVGEILFPEGSTVEVGTPIITVDTGGGDDASDTGPGGDPEPEARTEAGPTPAPREPETREKEPAREPVLVGYGVSAASSRRRPRKAAPAPAAAPEAPPAAAAPPATNGASLPGRSGVLAKPPVRKLAKDLGVDLAAVPPTGPGNVVTRDDVRAAAESAAPAAPVAPAAPAFEPLPAAEGERESPAVEPQSLAAIRERRVPVRGVRKATAQAMVDSAFTAPHVTEFVTVDITRTIRLVERLKSDPDMAGLRVNPLLLVARALLVGLRRNPEANAAWDEERQEIVYKDYVNLGIAAATPRGLLVPNIKDAHAKTLPELSRALGDLISTAREGKSSPADMRGGTVTITNIGVFGIDTGTPILNPGESAILAFGAIKDQPWVHKGKIKPRKVTTLALSFDHRLIDGELGSRLLGDVAAVLEHPKKLITWT
ncbi:pyruvate dehydrogenase E2 component (dihydrolipoamide acetyltransferase) [Streptomyces zhaozhouensis]|uniref:Dihydrolipoamide acetyltransferase component of pyruvate dehydrogenase complex n=1 Tax=Streptomyces zhaozhouensis TaxID=1300267 RepID=A0A286DX98_9ACTN|nr:dihydrolipoamide acetyltransferase family protein [Streptomyces zhaozhouensis]SOD63256.1 pyruvate dehydrogenase E2 component (dihydrolipoamide acetyltransferase) [Streptomyces zhaozhouensis]